MRRGRRVFVPLPDGFIRWRGFFRFLRRLFGLRRGRGRGVLPCAVGANFALRQAANVLPVVFAFLKVPAMEIPVFRLRVPLPLPRGLYGDFPGLLIVLECGALFVLRQSGQFISR